ncbi:ras and Rab interactor 2 isoform X1 [Nothobranchius furzeri]|uniref:Ras and Rab interactor 1 n=2 Tax=Nothobranchius furzeri TaxID=105023 RepID=A0A1A7ZUK7_NOTFU|nr:ras and Rab interactor 3 isoform X1 [Nothobranchius furzeri]XP_054603460.1 ras and Rab interactor 3 isoform X1 [Nothobranchius furzeri]KAF7229953.1 transcript variant X1 [Nothobranchius furzeri]
MQEVASTSQRTFSVLDRLLLTHPVWLQLSLNQDSALYILLREPIGTFLVRKCSSTQRKVLCLRVSVDRSASSVKECFICEEDSTFALESSALSFPDLCRLVAFYCISRDVLPFPLQLPEAISKATTHRQLEAISHMGQDFWSSPSAVDIQNGPLGPVASTSSSQAQMNQERCALMTQGRQGKVCFINPLFLQMDVCRQPQQTNNSASNKRNRFKRSMRLRLSETSMNLSLEGVGSYSPSPSMEQPDGPEGPLKANSQRRVHAGAGVLRRTPAVSPGSAEEDDMMPVYVPQTSTPVDAPPKLQQEQGIEGTVLALERRPAPSLAELDSSSSFSSMDEDNDSDPERESMAQTQTDTYRRPPLVRSRGRGGLHRMSEAFVCFFAPDKRLTRLVEELSRDRRSVFGGMVQDFLLEQRGVLKSLASASSSSSSCVTVVQLLQSLRLFLSRAKCCLLDSRELEPPIETLVPENEKDLALERAMFSCILRPLRCHLEKAMMALHNQDSSIQRLTQNMLRLKGDAAMEKLGVRTGVPDSREVEKVKQKLTLMQRTHSPIDKVLLLLQVCKYVHKAMGTLHGQEVSWDDLLPSLSYVIVECNRPQLLIEVEYMMELLEPSWLGGEGGYYLTSVYVSLCLIQNLEQGQPFSGSLTPQVQDSLKEWSCRRSLEAQKQKENQQSQRCVRILFQDGERSTVRTLQWRAGETSQALAQLCAATFGVSDPQQYTLYWRSGGEMRALPPQAQPQDLASHSEGGPSLSYLRTDHDFSKMRRLTRGGAVDLSESVCEE